MTRACGLRHKVRYVCNHNFLTIVLSLWASWLYDTVTRIIALCCKTSLIVTMVYYGVRTSTSGSISKINVSKIGSSDHCSVNQTRQTVVRPAAVLPTGIPFPSPSLPSPRRHRSYRRKRTVSHRRDTSRAQVSPLLVRSFDSCNVTGQKLEPGG